MAKRKRLPSTLASCCLAFSLGACAPATLDEGGEELGATGLQEPLQSSATLQPATPSLCWVQDTASTLTNAAFLSATSAWDAVIKHWEASSGLRFNFLGRCSPDSASAPASSNYSGNIRILYNEFHRQTETSIPGRGCTRDNGNGNNAYYPNSEDHRCQWNATISGFTSGNVLHESGHALGWIHEHQRSDNDSGCNGSHPIDDGVWLTRYDLSSVMHYDGCITHEELSARDILGVEIAYPPSANVKIGGGGMPFDGFMAIRLDSLVQTDWYSRGAIEGVFSNIRWQLQSGVSVLSPAFPANLFYADGDTDSLSVTFQDPWGRTKSGSQDIVISNSRHAAVLTSLL